MIASTVTAECDSLAICLANAWVSGTQLAGEPLPKEEAGPGRVIQIIELDFAGGRVLAQELFADGTRDEIKAWNLKCREWRELPRGR